MPYVTAQTLSGVLQADKDSVPATFSTYITPDSKWRVLKSKLRMKGFAVKMRELMEEQAQRVVPGGKGYQVGSDPEVFALRENGEVLPAFEFLPSKKEAKKDLNGITAHWDGYQAEFCMEPQMCHGYFTDRIYHGLKVIFDTARKVDPKATLTWKSVLEIPERLRVDAPIEHVQLGCAPSINIYEEFRPPIETARHLPWRFAGMHLHYGLLEVNDTYLNVNPQYQWTPERLFRAINAADHIGAVMVTAMLEGMEHPMRRQYYGRPGEYRVNKHRLEYRTMSSAVLAHPALLMFAIDMTRQAVRIGDTGMLGLIWSAKDDAMREAVINVDAKGCRKLLQKNENVVKGLVKLTYGESAVQFTWDMLMHGIKESMDIADNMMVKAWRLDPPPLQRNQYHDLQANPLHHWVSHSETTDGHFAYLQKALNTHGRKLALVGA